ncbi:hypothetical protein [Haloarcula nitratireducens]|uniref:PRC-barrel domain-containing protein n=1 Tax=Haloarcula nitratireducens TaxID=2487749 RepID=A0AAW4PFI3_9EURY|nr:hypothetical protein [Halomicroarcula nitratireducens]MBX0296745.1 hypothetical protein [Halomicroarcula nitratireducens]
MTDPTEDDIGKPILTAEGNRIGTLREIDYPTIYIEIDDEIDEELRSDIKVSETTARRANGKVLAGAPIGAIEGVTDEKIHFWPSYAAEARHEAVSYKEIPEEGGHEEPEERQ